MRIQSFDEATTKDLIAIVREWRRGVLLQSLTGGNQQVSTERFQYIHNNSGETIPPYACCQVTGTEDLGGQNFLLVDKPADVDGSSGWYIFNGHHEVADNEEGLAQVGPSYRVFKDSGTVTAGEAWAPTVDEWYLTQSDSGQFVAAGEDDIDTDVFRVLEKGGRSGATLYRFTLNESWSSGAADADILEMDGTDTDIDADVLDPLGIFSTLTTGDAGLCLLQGGSYYVIQAPCPA